jgi:3-hydroxyisobutyrate dehydrogenase-like beta-hydroxyacid dehydrogenase
MGSPMVLQLHKAGHVVSVLTRNAERRRQWAGTGVMPVDTVLAAAGDADAVVVCVHNDHQVRDVCLRREGIVDVIAPGTAVVIHTTGNPATSHAVMSAGATKNIEVLDAPVSGSPNDIAAGHITIYVGGRTATLERLRPLLRCYGTPILHVGDLGYGQRAKLVNNVAFAANIALLADAVRFGVDAGLSEDVVLTLLRAGSAGWPAISLVEPDRSLAHAADTLREFLSKDVAVARSVAGELGIDLGVLGSTLASDFARGQLLGET